MMDDEQRPREDIEGELQHIYECIATVHRDFEYLTDAKTLGDQANGITRLSNSMHDLVTWHPLWNVETGLIEDEEAVSIASESKEGTS